MDSDRKSTVSSFYGGRKSSVDALNHEMQPRSSNLGSAQPAFPRTRDDASSFYNPDRASRNLDQQPAERFGSAGYNRNSFAFAGRQEPLKGGRDEEEGATADAWDVYADFNNAGPKYSSAFGKEKDGYQPLDGTKTDEPSSPMPVEMVTVPPMGAEWQKSEMREMTKAGRKEKKADSRKQKWREFNRGERAVCFGLLKRKTLAFVVFGICIVVGVTLAFTIPRVPSFLFNSDDPLSAASGPWLEKVPQIFSRSPANFSFPAFVDIRADTGGNFLPLKFNHIYAEVFDLDTGRKVATGDLAGKTVPAKDFPILQLPLNFTYTAANDTDQTWKNWYDGCRNKLNYPDATRPGVKFRLLLDIHIAGLIGSSKTATQIASANCPIQLPTNSV